MKFTEQQTLTDEERRNRKPWEKDFVLEPFGTFGLFNEYMEIRMII